jgi:hypothetical protein
MYERALGGMRLNKGVFSKGKEEKKFSCSEKI